ncbi:MAG: glycosyltransferase family 2 protein [Lactococcus raffinolactis]|jgi:glycosyltransferase involved in cell wall biosynthesis|uniref:Glycosyltransferase n=1 Tax=Pseudolactococcus raffinolactis TaxID=1366 RepID=A0A290PYE2_9LACT|nr:glycosyltransferase family 2 protein [Lactococcus raffinolactis]ATC61107.1 glycosyltransferase [Lactococcus raffinolactis]MBW9330654.1 glycosyltransferase [Lactococcus raffinolactis]MDG4961959.1 glycosyltransferase family 2 protein [Lactococcus raffinolactis]MDN5414350.1 glycosyltransferase family 2 protein [Lactococcus raffinolactis]MDN5579271.1 glycosyltransferase family 2 protein [Lactococcus raffinolactis]
MNTLTIIVPCFNEADVLVDFISTVNLQTQELPLIKKYLLINDGSTDDTLDIMKNLSETFDNIFYLSFSRNFGKEAAILAGLEASDGDFVTIMDADLQDPPFLLTEMYKDMLEGQYDIVGCRRISRKGEPFIRSFLSRSFYWVINHLSHTEIPSGVRDFRLMTRQVVNEILRLTEVNRFSKGLLAWVGFKTKYLTYENIERKAGKTSWHFWQLISYSIDGIVNFSDAPLNFATLMGFISFIISMLLAAFYTFKTLIFGDPVQGFPTLITLLLLIGGIQLFALGIIGKYIGKIFLETKHRPIYIIKEKHLD